MANVCNKCGNNLYGNKTKCPFCGEAISSSSRSSYSTPSNSGSTSKGTGNKLNSSNYSNNNNSYSGYSNNNSQRAPRSSSGSADTGSAGWGLLGFCFPIVGIILYLVWQNDQPLNAKSALNGALIALVVGFIFGLFSACAQVSYY